MTEYSIHFLLLFSITILKLVFIRTALNFLFDAHYYPDLAT